MVYCKETNLTCDYTNDINRYSEADAVVINMGYANHKSLMPHWKRPAKQKWINYIREAPDRYSLITGNSQFNISMSFSPYSDIYMPYAKIGRKSIKSTGVEDDAMLSDILSVKSKSVLWTVSHCKTQSRRETYADQLGKHIDIDVFGNCGTPVPCLRTDRRCENRFVTDYYFYLSFENSLCEHYITEKTFTRMQQGLVPVVLGGADYKNVLPVGSYIDVRDYESPKALAKYLKRLIREPDEYAKYHEWRRTEKVLNLDVACMICEYITKNKNIQEIIPDMNKIWDPKKLCTPFIDFYAGILDYDFLT